MSLDVARSLLARVVEGEGSWRTAEPGSPLVHAGDSPYHLWAASGLTCWDRRILRGFWVLRGSLVWVCLHSSDTWPCSDLAGLEDAMVSTEPRPRPWSPHCHPRGTSPPSAGLRFLPTWEDKASVSWRPSGTRVLTWPANLHSPLSPTSSTSWAAARPLATLSTDESFSVLTSHKSTCWLPFLW